MAKIRKFREGSTVEDAEEAKFKVAGLAASNAELERGERKPSGFLGLGRFLQGNIDQKGSEAYNLYGAGYGREVEAKNDRLREKTEREAAANERRKSDEARDAKAAASEDDPEKKFFGAGANNRPSAAELAAASAQRARDAARGAAGSGSGSASTGSGATTPEKGDKGARDTSSFKKSTSAGSGSGSGATTPEKGDKGARDTGRSQGSTGSGSASGSGGGRGPTYDQVDADKQKGFTASPMSKDPSQRAKPAASAPAAEKPLSQDELKADADKARESGNSSGSKDPYADDITLSLEERRKRLAQRIKRRTNSDKETQSKSVTERFKESFKAKGGVIKSYAKGGSVSASRRGDGIAQRGKTRGKMY